MNYRLLLFLLLLFTSVSACAQFGNNAYLFVKKGAKKKRTYEEYQRIMLIKKDGVFVEGFITRMANDTIFLAGKPVTLDEVDAVVIRADRKKLMIPDTKTLLLITAGSAMTAFGLTLNDMEEPKEAIIAGAAMGFGALIARNLIYILKPDRKKFKIGKKFRLQILDFHMPPTSPKRSF